MGPVQTLHEFVLNLLSDTKALEAFQADPQGVLDLAGLGDVTAADVQEVIPLVMDTAPVEVLKTLGTVGGALEDPTGFLDQLQAGVVGALPNVEGTLESVSNLTDQLGVNDLAVDVLDGVSGVVDSVAEITHDVPLVGPIVDGGAEDLHYTVDAVAEHAHDGKFLGATVDAATNHLGDALLPDAAVEGVSELPLVGEPVSDILETVQYAGGGLVGEVNEELGSTQVGIPSGEILHDAYNGTELTHVVGSVTGAVGDLTDNLLGGLTGSAQNADVPEVDTSTAATEDLHLG